MWAAICWEFLFVSFFCVVLDEMGFYLCEEE